MNDLTGSTQDSTRDQEWDASAIVAATSDGRWALVSTSITALVAGTIAWLAIGAMPPIGARTHEANTTYLPYALFSELAQAGSRLASGYSVRHTQPTPAGDLDAALAAEDAEDNGEAAGIETRTLTLESGSTLAGLLEDAGVPNADANAAVAALAKIFNIRSTRAGQSFQLTFQLPPEAVPLPPDTTPGVINIPLPNQDDANDADPNGVVTPATPTPVGRLLSIAFSPTVEQNITISRAADGSFSANDVVKQLVQHHHRAGATIDSSLYLAATQAGIPTDVVIEMIHMFSYKVDFQRDLKPGDTFEVYYDYYYTPEGQLAKPGNIAYAVIRTGGKEITLYRFQPDPNQPADYFDAHGENVKGMLMKTPVDGARISSGFGMRFHPVLGYTRMHKGIDFAVPVGTPVMAAGTGTVKIAGRMGGYGNYLRIDMGNGYGTAYGHLSRFAPGIHMGSRVRQGQVVAYSGNTGMSTGPHLHYEILVKGEQVNPLKVKVAQGRKLAGNELRTFLDSRLRTDALLASTPLETKVADAATDLRQAKAR
ncbi:MAG TPA: M23 family metallopeptidase [Rhizomicrobium sp.]|nr:M23 family metallopeptidase [Rhizomicrobium sp.]